VSLQDWVAQGWIQEHKTSPEEIRSLFALADRDLEDAQVANLSAEWRLIIAYNSALRSATAALAAAGYRPSAQASHHYYVIESLHFTIRAEAKLITQLDRFRKKRNISTYEQSGVVSDQEAAEMLALARELRVRVQQWLEKHHVKLLRSE
jgi:uncharacterized protein (UPF0332 family)